VICIIWAIVENRGAVSWDDLALGLALIGASVALFALLKYMQITAVREALRDAESDQESTRP
jgi:hypothetical protein